MYILRGFLWIIELIIIFLLIIYNLRRVLFLLAMLLPNTRDNKNFNTLKNQFKLPDILILVPCRDEEDMITDLCQTIDYLDYPKAKYQVVLIDDGSQDDTRIKMEEAVSGRNGWYVLSLTSNVGKASALNFAIDKYLFGDIIIIYDADHRPQPDSLTRVVQYFSDASVAGVSGRTVPSNSLASPVAYYSTIEIYLHQMVTMRAKDRLNLAPTLLGSNCGYRRSALLKCGGFRPGVLLEDSDMSLTFYHFGYKIRFVEDSISFHQVPQTISGYVKQHTRWAHGFNDIFQYHIRDLIREKGMPIFLRFELILFASGYLDRVALTCAGFLIGLSFVTRRLYEFSWEILWFALLTPLAQVIVLFIEQHIPLAMWLRLPWMPAFFLFDLYISAKAMVDSLMKRTQVWTNTERVQTHDLNR
jgi:1,2-diacylglycerol 3-beta-glucosyltransferase